MIRYYVPPVYPNSVILMIEIILKYTVGVYTGETNYSDPTR